MRAAVRWNRLRLNHAGVAQVAAAVHLGVAVQQLDICAGSGTPMTYACLGTGVKLTATTTKSDGSCARRMNDTTLPSKSLQSIHSKPV